MVRRWIRAVDGELGLPWIFSLRAMVEVQAGAEAPEFLSDLHIPDWLKKLPLR